MSLTKIQKAKIQKALDSLEGVRAKLAVDGKDINWYLEDNGNLCLMDGETHDDRGASNMHMIMSVPNN